jgi:hypothetical protein
MAPSTTKSQENSDPNAQSTHAQATAATSSRASKPHPEALIAAPVFYKRQKTKRGKRKKKYTKGTKGWQKLGDGINRAEYRSANALAKGLRTFVKRNRKSARKKRDGMVRYSLRDASRGFADGFKEAGRVPGEIARRIPTRTVRGLFRVFSPFGG